MIAIFVLVLTVIFVVMVAAVIYDRVRGREIERDPSRRQMLQRRKDDPDARR